MLFRLSVVVITALVGLSLAAVESLGAQGVTNDQQTITAIAKLPSIASNGEPDLLMLIANDDASLCKQLVEESSISLEQCRILATQELLHRRPVPDLLNQLRAASLTDGRGVTAATLLEKIGGAGVDKGMRQLAHDSDYGIGQFTALMHFAKRCEKWSLSSLREHANQFEIPSYIWAGAIQQFGKCNYYPATELLVANLGYASLNVVAAADESLHRLYPDGPSTTFPPDQMEQWKSWLVASGKNKLNGK